MEPRHRLEPPKKPQHSPTIAQPIKYGEKVQKATPVDTSARLTKEGIEKIQKVVGAFAWYAGATNPTMPKTLSSIAGRQTQVIKDLEKRLNISWTIVQPIPMHEVHGKQNDISFAFRCVLSV